MKQSKGENNLNNRESNNNNNININWNELETKWKSKWKEEHLFEANYDNTNKKKYFITVAFPYPNSPQHIGHGRTYALADVHARYMRMKGYNVLFPMGFHYTGTPILAMSKRVIAHDQDLIGTFKNLYNVPEDIIKSFTEPENIAKYFHNEIKLGMQDIGYSIDWRREFTTIDSLYSKFITWQFKALQKKGLIVQGSHPVGWCPYDNNPVSQHDTLGDVEPEFSEYILIKFKSTKSNVILPTATLRPETIFGVTNLWVNPYIEYFLIDVDDTEQWIVTEEAATKLKFLNHDVKFNKIIKGNELIGKFATDIIRNVDIPILPAKFVKSDTGTGIVMSVPGHAPYDFQALSDLKKETSLLSSSYGSIDLSKINPIKIIKVQNDNNDNNNDNNETNSSMLCLEDAISKFKINSQSDLELEKATNEVYHLEYYQGKMLSNTGKYSGMSVQLAKEDIKSYLITTNNFAEVFYELINKPIKCRCGNECVVKLLNDQWFINYSDKEWKYKVHNYIDEISILPDDLRQEFHNVVDWLKERACARKSGLGTKLPWDHEWIIESLSDSVIYMAYYIISKFVNEQKNSMKESLSNIDETFFDYVLLGIGDVHEVTKNCNLSISLLEEIRNEFLYFYPVDSRHSGRDLVPNHLTFFIFNHVALFEKRFWPRQIVVNGSVLMEGKKMSKSLGNIIPLRTAIQEYGADTIRLAILISSELLQDADFSFDTAKSIRMKLLEFYDLSQQQQIFFNSNFDNKLSNPTDLSLDEFLYRSIISKNEYILELEDKWLISKLQRLINNVTKSLETLRVREALHNILYVFDQDIHWYKKRITAKKRDNDDVVNNILVLCFSIRIKLLSPFAPFISEEIWNSLGNTTSIVSSKWPANIFSDQIDSLSEESEEFLKRLASDISNIIKVTKKLPNNIYIYCSSTSKQKIYQKTLKIITLNNERNFGNIMKKLIEDPETSYAKKDPSFVKKIVEDILSESVESRINRLNLNSFDEISIIKDSQNLISKEIEVENVQIVIY
ncbi:MAG TPA: leucine--tRNA ligase, partial [Nitrososphaeraceae archaeon]|nr:leucine--tRNA ligase [Nitrososphaeraceae archaeon]